MAAAPTTPTATRVASTSVSNQVPSPHYATTRRHSLYGTEDRIVIDPGSRVWKVGFSGEGRPRDVFVTANPKYGSSLWSFSFGKTAAEQADALILLEQRLQDLLRSVFFESLLVDPRSRKVIIAEHPLLPLAIKEALARILFQNLQVPSISFAPSHVLALMAAGRLTGLVLDCGYLESSALPIYGSRPLYTSIRSTPLAGARLSAHLRSLLLLFGSYLPPMGVVGSAPKATSVPEEVLTDAVVEEVKTRCCFVGEPIHSSKNRPRSSSSSTVAADDAVSVDTSGDSAPSESGHPRVSVEVDNPSDPAPTTYPGRQLSVMRDLYVRHSSATDLRLVVPVPGAVPSGAGTSTTIRATLIIPGWVRERAAEVLFEDGDVDETSVAEVILDALLKVPIDLRKDFACSIVVSGGTSMLPGFIPRVQAELSRLLSPSPPPTLSIPPRVASPSTPTPATTRFPPTSTVLTPPAKPTYDPYSALRRLAPFIAILNSPAPPQAQSTQAKSNAGKAPAFAPASLAWIGGSLAGALKTGGEEVLRERWDEAIEEVLEDRRAVGSPDSPATSIVERANLTTRVHVLPDWTKTPLVSGAPGVHAPPL